MENEKKSVYIDAVPVTANVRMTRNNNDQLSVKYLKLDRDTIKRIEESMPEAFVWSNHTLTGDWNDTRIAEFARLTGTTLERASAAEDVLQLAEVEPGTGIGTKAVTLAMVEKGQYTNVYVNDRRPMKIFDNRE